ELAGYFPIVAASGATGFYKTDPRLYLWTLEQLGVAAQQAVYVGDHPRFDVEGAQAAGMRAVLFDGGSSGRLAETSNMARPDAIITHLDELPSVLERLAG